MQPMMATAPNAVLPLGRHAEDQQIKAAGLLIWTKDGAALFLKRSAKGDHAGEWCLPGGKIEAGEEASEAAIRETREETGWIPQKDPPSRITEIDHRESSTVDFVTFAVKVGNQFIPELDDEHNGWSWAPISNPPQPLHPGVAATIQGLRYGEGQAEDAGTFKESDHPRGKGGKNAGRFVKKGAGGGSGSPAKEAKETTKSSSAVKAAKPPTRQKQYKAIDGVASFLDHVSKITSAHMPEGMVSPQGFILRNGNPYTANDKTFDGASVGKKHECFKNAALEALRNPDRTYVEGFVSVHGVPVEHAWTVDKSGQIYDHTIASPDGIEGYFGVPFSKDFLKQALNENRVYGLLGYASRKTLDPLLKGEVENFGEAVDVNALSDSAVTDRLAFAARRLRSIPHTDKIDTIERDQLRRKIHDDLYNKDIDKRRREHQVTIILGLPGAGKSTFAQPLLDDGSIEIDPDLAKAMLPEFGRGEGAAAVHEESSAITREVLARAIGNGDNFVWPRVDSPDKIVRDVESLHKAGYQVHVKYIEVERSTSIQACITRFLKKGRYVDPLVVDSYGDSPRKAYEAAVNTGLLASNEAHQRGPKGGFSKLED